MNGLDDLPPDQRAALSLLLRQRKSYGEVAELLGIPERTVQERAYAALDALANGAGAGDDQLSAAQRAEIGDYLLGQQPGVAERLRAHTQLDGSPAARLWASALASELAPLASTPLPEIPVAAHPPAAGEQSAAAKQPARSSANGEIAAPPDAAPPGAAPPDAPPSDASAGAAPPGASRPLPSSRLGGALLLTAIITGVIVAVVLSTGEGGGSRGSRANTTPAGAAPSATGTSPSATTGTSSTSTSASRPSTTSTGPSEQARIPLTSPNPASKTIGVAVILAEGGQHAFYLAAERVPPTKGFFYAVWLYNSPSSFEALGKSPPVSANGRMQGGALLPTNAAGFSKLIVTRETSTRPGHPGPIILSGAVKLGH